MGFGTDHGEEARRLVDICLDAGVTMFDSADIYSARRVRDDSGRGDQGPPRQGAHLDQGHVPHRPRAQRCRLVALPSDRRRSRRALKRLGTDYIDLFQLHGFDAKTPVEETLSTLDDLVRAGKIRYIGVSNFSGWHLMKSLAGRRALRLSALCREPDLLFADRPRLRVGADAAGPRPGRRRGGLEPAGLGPAHRQDPPRRSRCPRSAVCTRPPTIGPPVDDEYLYQRGRRARRGRAPRPARPCRRSR